MRRDERVLLIYFITVVPMVDNILKWDVPIYFSIDLIKHVLRYCIGRKQSFVPAIIIYLIQSCIQDCVIVASVDWQPVLVPQTLIHCSKFRPVSVPWYLQLHV